MFRSSGRLQVVLPKVIKMIKYDTVVYRYDQILVDVGAQVIPG
jgi:hypothetical protein